MIGILLLAGGLLEQGEQLYRKHDLEGARAIFQQLARQDPSSTRARLWLGYTELALGRLEAAIRTLEPLETKLGSDDEFLYSLSEAYTRRARELSNQIAALGDGSARAHQLLAYRYRAEGDVRNAESEFRRALDLRPDVPGLHLDLGNLLWEQKRHDEASAAFVAELKIQPNEFMANLRYGQYLLLRRQPEHALGPLRIAARHGAWPEPFQLLAYAYEKSGRVDEAKAVLNAGFQLFPQDEGIAEMRARLEATSGGVWKFDALKPAAPAVASLRKRVAAGAGSEDDLFLLSQHYSGRGQALAETLERAAPRSYRTLQLKGLSAEYAHKWAEAEDLYRQVLEMKPDLPGAHTALGVVLVAQGKDAEAEEQFRAELALDPKNHLALFELGARLIRKGEAGEAVALLSAARDLRPDFQPGLLELGKALLQVNQPSRAAPYLEEVVTREPNHSSAHFLLYRTYLMLGAKDKASSHLKRHQAVLRTRGAADRSGMR